MKKLSFYFAKLKSKVLKNNEIMNDYYRSCGAKIGGGGY